MVGEVAEARRMDVRLYTDSYLVRGWTTTTAPNIYDLLTAGEPEILAFEQVNLTEHSTGDLVREVPFAQVHVATILFAIADEPIDAAAELAVPPLAEKALVIVPPFRLIGSLHAATAADLRTALGGLSGRFLAFSGATHWSESLREPRTAADLVAVNRAKAQIFAPYQERDVWGDVPGGRDLPRREPGPS